MINYFLAKSEPDTYSIDNLRSDLSTIWDGVKNPQALKVLRSMQPGDLVFIYHSGGSPAVAGIAEVASAPRPDPKNEKLTVVELRYKAHLTPPLPLADVKLTGRFGDWALLRQPRLSVMAVPDEFVEWIRTRYPSAAI